MGELKKMIKERVRAAVEDARIAGHTHVASAVNVGGEGHTTSVYSDGEVTVVTRDGETEVIRHRDDNAGGDPLPHPK